MQTVMNDGLPGPLKPVLPRSVANLAPLVEALSPARADALSNLRYVF
jgi:hypothetical protein